MTYSAKVTTVCCATMACSLSISAFLLTRIDRIRGQASNKAILYVPSASSLRKLSLGYTGLMADIYWTRAVQYFGERHRERSTDYALLGPLLELTTDLDPKLTVAYQFGATFLAQNPPEGAGVPGQAVKLVEKGIRENPDQWKLYYDLGFLEATERQDYLAAARAFERGAQVRGAHPSLKILAAAMAQRGGDRSTARLLWSTTYDTTTDEMIRSNAFQHLQAIRVDDDIDHLEVLLRQYRERTGHYPGSMFELVSAGMLPGVPVDPLGHPYKVMPQGRVEVQHPEKLSFITRGLPPGRRASPLPQTKVE